MEGVQATSHQGGISTWRERERLVARYEEWFRGPVKNLTVSDLRRDLPPATSDAYRIHRSIPRSWFETAQRHGFYPPDRKTPAELLEPKTPTPKKRKRLSKEQFDQTHELAPYWVQIATDISLLTFMRVGDVVKLKRKDCPRFNIRWIPSKIRNHPDPLPTEARLTEPAWKKTIGRSGSVSYVIAHPETGKPVDEKYIARRFGKLSTEVTGLPPGTRPTFHKIRSLSEALYRSGEAKEVTQRRMTHHDSRQTAEYDVGHAVHYEPVDCLLDL